MSGPVCVCLSCICIYIYTFLVDVTYLVYRACKGWIGLCVCVLFVFYIYIHTYLAGMFAHVSIRACIDVSTHGIDVHSIVAQSDAAAVDVADVRAHMITFLSSHLGRM
jgi:hypothetical protein